MNGKSTWVVTALAGLGLTYFGVSLIRPSFAARRWPTTAGRIEKVDPANKPCFTFSYQVEGRPHTSTTVLINQDYAGNAMGSPCDPALLVKYLPNSEVTVFYNPANPDQAVLDPRAPTGIWMFTAVGALMTIMSLAQGIAQRIGSRARQLAPAAFAGGPLPDITPSEVVMIDGARFAGKDAFDSILLLDNRTSVSSHEFVTAQLMAALLEHERRGTVEFAIDGERVLVNPTGKTATWPSPSLESRLDFRPGEVVEAAVSRWAIVTHRGAWSRAAEKTMIPLVLRGLATATPTAAQRSYGYGGPNLPAAAENRSAEVAALLDGCKAARPELWNLLTAEIVRGIESGKAANANADPWSDESEVEVDRALGVRLRGASSTVHAIGALASWAVGLVIAYAEPDFRRPFAIATALGILIALSARWWWRRAALVAKLPQHKIDLLAADIAAQGWWKMSLIIAPIAAYAMIWPVQNASNPLALILCAAVLGWVGFVMLQKKAGQAIVGQVSGKPRAANRSASFAAAAGASVTSAGPATAAVRAPELPFDLEVIEPGALPAASTESQSKLNAIRQRGPAVRQLYWSSLHWLALPATALAAAMSVPFVKSEGNRAVLPLLTILWVIFTLFGWRLSKQKQDSAAAVKAQLAAYGNWLRDKSGNPVHVTAIRPLAGPFFGMMWVVWTLALGALYYTYKSPVKWFGVAVSAGLAIYYLVRIHTGRKKLETQYPVYAPLNLLALRVFDSPSRDRFLELLQMWHWFGPIYRLDGPDTAGGKTSDVVAYLTGRLHAAIVEDVEELRKAETAFKRTRDSQLRFGINSMQCNNATWKDAIQHMFDGANVVVMDLSGLSRVNQGSAYEIKKLVKEVPFERFFLLVNAATDMTFLREILADAARERAIPPGARRDKLRILDIGTVPQRRDGESVYDWQKRLASVVDEDRLIGLLHDAAVAGDASRSAPLRFRWTRPKFLPAPAG